MKKILEHIAQCPVLNLMVQNFRDRTALNKAVECSFFTQEKHPIGTLFDPPDANQPGANPDILRDFLHPTDRY